MSRTVYLNGQWLPEAEARISIFDRGFLFADAIYEVTAVIGAKLIDYAGHAARLRRSLSALSIRLDMDDEAMLALHREIVMHNNLNEGLIYLQISRGAQDRDFLFSPDLEPTVTLFTQAKQITANPTAEKGISVITMPDGRWVLRQIKTVQLLYSSLAKMEAHKQGADDVLFVENGMVTEASSANAYIVTRDGVLVTRELSNAILSGITRASVLNLAEQAGLTIEERPFSPQEAMQASEVFITSATAFVMPVVSIDGNPVGDGKVGPAARLLRDIYFKHVLATAV